MKKIISSFLLLISFAGCDPGHVGNTFINNESDFQLKLYYHSERSDTTLIIEPNSYIEVFHFGGLGAGKDYDCCSCEFLSITLKPSDTSKNLVKDISRSDNWNMSNTNRRRYSNHEITCDFIVRADDIQ